MPIFPCVFGSLERSFRYFRQNKKKVERLNLEEVSCVPPIFYGSIANFISMLVLFLILGCVVTPKNEARRPSRACSLEHVQEVVFRPGHATLVGNFEKGAIRQNSKVRDCL